MDYPRQCPHCLKTETELVDRRALRMSLGSRKSRRQSTKCHTSQAVSPNTREAPKKRLERKVRDRMETHIENCEG